MVLLLQFGDGFESLRGSRWGEISAGQEKTVRLQAVGLQFPAKTTMTAGLGMQAPIADPIPQALNAKS